MNMNQFGAGEVKNIDKSSFFKFDKFYFPMIARFLFAALVALILLTAVVGMVGSLAAMFTTGVFSGLLGVVVSAVYAVAAIFFVRIWFELILVAFNINDALQEIKVNTRREPLKTPGSLSSDAVKECGREL